MSSSNTSVDDNRAPGMSNSSNCANNDEDGDFMINDSVELTYSDNDDYSIGTSSNVDSDHSLSEENGNGPKQIKNQCDNSTSTLPGVSSCQNFSPFELLKELYRKSDEDVINTISDLLSWLTANAISNLEGHYLNIPDANDVYYVSCALWICQELLCNNQVSALLTADMYSLYLKWSFSLPLTSTTKRAIDRVLCSMYALKPEMYQALLESMNIIHSEGHSSNEKPHYQFKHIAAGNLQAPYHADRLSPDCYQSLTDSKYTTLANVSQSFISSLQLMQSGFLSQLVDVIVDICLSYNVLKANGDQSVMFQRITLILSFFAELCWNGQIRTWMASSEVIIFWERLLELLAMVKSCEIPGVVSQLRDAAIRFFCKCCWCYPANSTKLAYTLVTVFPRFMERDSSKEFRFISEFGRQIIVKLIMAVERVYVSVETNLPNNFRTVWSLKNYIPSPPPPSYPSTKKHQLICIDTNLSCVDVIAEVMGEKSETTKRAKQRLSESSVVLDSSPSKRLKSEGNPKLLLWDQTESRYISVDQEMKISQMLSILHAKGDTLEAPLIKLLLTEQENNDAIYTAEWGAPLSLMKSLVDINGFDVIATNSLAEYEFQLPSKSKKKKLAHTHCLPPHLYMTNMQKQGVITTNERYFRWSAIPVHSLILLGQFMKLKDYQDEISSKQILEALWGAENDDRFDIAAHKTLFAFDPSKLFDPIATLPLNVLYLCLKKAFMLDTSNIRSDIITYGITDVMFYCLTIFTHQSEKSKEDFLGNPHSPLLNALKQVTTLVPNKRLTTMSNNSRYWPKGVGYGSGSSCGDTNLENGNAKRRLVAEEEFVTALFYVLAAYINPDFRLYELYPEYIDDICNAELNVRTKLPCVFLDQVERSCLLPILADYLRNDSIMDIFRHVQLYKALMQLLRCLASNEHTVKYLVSNNHSSMNSSTSSESSFISLNDLLQKMKNQADTYSFSFVKNVVASGPGTSTAHDESSDEDENLISDIKITAIIVNIVSERYKQLRDAIVNEETAKEVLPSMRKTPSTAEVAVPVVSNEEIYLEIMKKLSFGSYDIVSEPGVSKVAYSFNKMLLEETNNHPSRIRRLALESSTLSSSLPLTYSSAVFVRCDTNRLDVMKVLITGPANTPYMNGCFEFDVFFPSSYPSVPMNVKLVTTGQNRVRFNPNLYDCGKVCLSLLNTWHGRPEEMWNSQTSTLVQVLISIQALIFVPDPYFNEPGYQGSRGTTAGTTASNKYNANLLPATIRWAMIDQIRNPSPCFEKVIKTHFMLKKDEILQQVTNWINEEKKNKAPKSVETLNTLFQQLSRELSKLKPTTEET